MANGKKLNPKQEKFCQLYATEAEFFGNGVQAYIEAYEPSQSSRNWYASAQASASRLLSKVIICERINQLLEEAGLNDQNVDKQLLFLINQHADFKSKTAAIREYNKLKSRIKDKTEIEVTHKYEDMTDEQLEAALKARDNRAS